MKLRFLLIVAAVAVAALTISLFWLKNGQRVDATPTAPADQAARALPATETVAVSPREQALQALIEELQESLAAATVAREQAEADLAQSEIEVTELERFIEEIEARGEDPADYAEEGLERFQPAFYRYQDAFSAFEQAELMEREASRQLTEAYQQLDALRSD